MNRSLHCRVDVFCITVTEVECWMHWESLGWVNFTFQWRVFILKSGEGPLMLGTHVKLHIKVKNGHHSQRYRTHGSHLNDFPRFLHIVSTAHVTRRMQTSYYRIRLRQIFHLLDSLDAKYFKQLQKSYLYFDIFSLFNW